MKVEDAPGYRFADRVHKLAHDRRLTIVELSKRSGVSTSSLYRVFAGRREPSARMLTGLADALGVTPGVLLGEPEAETRGEIRELVEICNGLTYDQLYRVKMYARYEASLITFGRRGTQ